MGRLLQRSEALCGDDDTRLSTRSIEKQGSKTSSLGSSLSRDSSSELYTDSTGINLEEFIINTLHKNQKDRQMLLSLEQEFLTFINDDRTLLRFHPMSSYCRMLVHRVAAFFGLDHNVDQSGNAVVVNKKDTTRLPEVRFKDYIQNNIYTDEPRRLILARKEHASYEEAHMTEPHYDMRKARSFEEREEAYERTRAKIFNQDSSSSADGLLESPISGRSSESIPQYGTGSSVGTGSLYLHNSALEIRPWSSTDSSSLEGTTPMTPGGHAPGGFRLANPHLPLTATPSMHKAGSFGGVPVVYRGDGAKIPPRRSNTDSNKEASGGGGALVRQSAIHSGASAVGGLSGNGAAVISQGLPMVGAGGGGMVPGPGAGGVPAGGYGDPQQQQQQQVVFAVASYDQVPAGACIMNPNTGEPYYNADGSLYRHNPILPIPPSPALHTYSPPTPSIPHPAQPTIIDPGGALGGQLSMMSLGGSPGHRPHPHPQAQAAHISPGPGPGGDGRPVAQPQPQATNLYLPPNHQQVYAYVMQQQQQPGVEGVVSAQTSTQTSIVIPQQQQYMQSMAYASSLGHYHQGAPVAYTQAGPSGTQVTPTQAGPLAYPMAFYQVPGAVPHPTTQYVMAAPAHYGPPHPHMLPYDPQPPLDPQAPHSTYVSVAGASYGGDVGGSPAPLMPYTPPQPVTSFPAAYVTAGAGMAEPSSEADDTTTT